MGPSAVGPHLKRVRAAQAPAGAGVEGPVRAEGRALASAAGASFTA